MNQLILALSLLAMQMPARPIDWSAKAREAVGQFYAWYVPASRRAGADMRALSDARWHFAPALKAAMRADRKAAEANPNEIVGLDMDPFLNAQDPCNRYRPTAVRRAGSDFLVDVKGEGGCAAHRTPDVTVRVAIQSGVPVFVNFEYPAPVKDDLMRLLGRLAAERTKPKR